MVDSASTRTTQALDEAVLADRRVEQIRGQIDVNSSGSISQLLPEMPVERVPLVSPLYGAEEVAGLLRRCWSRTSPWALGYGSSSRSSRSSSARSNAIMVNSGSSANLLGAGGALEPVSARVPSSGRRGDRSRRVVVHDVAPILQHGCVPVLVDIDPTTLNLRPEDLEEALSGRTRAIMPVHLLGNPVNMAPLMEFAREHDLWVVEDTCESLGSSVGGEQVGSFGHFGAYSFYFSHHITTIEGGMLVTDDDHLADLARSIRAHGWTRELSNRLDLEAANPSIDPRFLFVHIGYNLRPMEIQGAFGVVQLDRLTEFNTQRRKNAHYLLDALSDLSAHMSFVTEQPGGRSTWFGFTMILKDADTRRASSAHLEARNIATRPVVAGNLAIQPAFRENPHRTVGALPHATRIGEHGLFVGNHPNLTTAAPGPHRP